MVSSQTQVHTCCWILKHFSPETKRTETWKMASLEKDKLIHRHSAVRPYLSQPCPRSPSLSVRRSSALFNHLLSPCDVGCNLWLVCVCALYGPSLAAESRISWEGRMLGQEERKTRAEEEKRDWRGRYTWRTRICLSLSIYIYRRVCVCAYVYVY